MLIKFGKGNHSFGFSCVLNKAPYSFCINPHIGFFVRGRVFLGLRFPPEWRIWNIETSANKRRAEVRSRFGHRLARLGCVQTHKFGWGGLMVQRFIGHTPKRGSVSVTYISLLRKTFKFENSAPQYDEMWRYFRDRTYHT